MHSPKWNKYSKDYKVPFYAVKFEDFVKIAKEENFKVKYLEIKNVEDYYPSKIKFESSYKVIPFVNFIPDNIKQDFFEEVFSNYYRNYKEFLKSDGSVLEVSPTITIILEK